MQPIGAHGGESYVPWEFFALGVSLVSCIMMISACVL